MERFNYTEYSEFDGSKIIVITDNESWGKLIYHAVYFLDKRKPMKIFRCGMESTFEERESYNNRTEALEYIKDQSDFIIYQIENQITQDRNGRR